MKWKRNNGVCGAVLALLVGVMAMPVIAQEDAQPNKEKPPEATVNNVTRRGRNGGPLIIDLTVRYRGKKVFRGPVEFTITRSGNVVATVSTPEIVVLDGETTHRYVLPTVDRLHEGDSTNVTIRMFTEDGTLNLGTHPLMAPSAQERSLVMGVVDPWKRGAGRASQLISSLSFERFKPSRNERGVTALPAMIEPGSVPSDAVSLCAFDVLIVPAEGLSELEENQLAAIRAWVRAGGSAAIMLGGNLNTLHARFLNETIAGDGQGHRFVAQPGGTIGIEPEAPATNVAVYDAGFGRLVVATDASDVGLYDSPAWKMAGAHLWRFRASQRGLLRAGQPWDKSQERPTQQYDQWGNEIDRSVSLANFRYQPLPIPQGHMLEALLMPTSVRVVPFGLVVVILVVFAFAVGPGDWLVLGLIRQHKLTWVVFPVVAIAFTVLTVFVAEYYMGTRSYERALVFEDVDATGTVLRRSRLQLTFSATQKRIEHELSGELLKPMSPTAFVQMENYGYNSGQIIGGATAEAASASREIVGRYPTSYVAHQRVQKWSPRMDRFTQIAPQGGDHPTHIQWGKINLDLLESNGLKSIVPSDFQGAVLVYHGRRDPSVVAGNPGLAAAGYDTSASNVTELVTDLSVRPREGMFTIVSQVSPNGSDSLEDLSAFDQDDSDQWLIVVLEARGDDLMVYRYLHREPGDRR